MVEPSDIISPCIPVRTRLKPQQSRVYRDGGGHLLKFSRGGNAAKVEREFRFLQALNASPYFPEPLGFGPEWMVMTDLGEPEPITDMEEVAKHGCLLLRDLKMAEIRHNDLIAPNILIRDNIPYAVDFGWSRWEHEPRLACIDDTVMLPHTLQTMWQLSRALSRLGAAA